MTLLYTVVKDVWIYTSWICKTLMWEWTRNMDPHPNGRHGSERDTMGVRAIHLSVFLVYAHISAASWGIPSYICENFVATVFWPATARNNDAMVVATLIIHKAEMQRENIGNLIFKTLTSMVYKYCQVSGHQENYMIWLTFLSPQQQCRQQNTAMKLHIVICYKPLKDRAFMRLSGHELGHTMHQRMVFRLWP